MSDQPLWEAIAAFQRSGCMGLGLCLVWLWPSVLSRRPLHAPLQALWLHLHQLIPFEKRYLKPTRFPCGIQERPLFLNSVTVIWNLLLVTFLTTPKLPPCSFFCFPNSELKYRYNHLIPPLPQSSGLLDPKLRTKWMDSLVWHRLEFYIPSCESETWGWDWFWWSFLLFAKFIVLEIWTQLGVCIFFSFQFSFFCGMSMWWGTVANMKWEGICKLFVER